MGNVYVIRYKVMAEGKSINSVARWMSMDLPLI